MSPSPTWRRWLRWIAGAAIALTIRRLLRHIWDSLMDPRCGPGDHS